MSIVPCNNDTLVSTGVWYIREVCCFSRLRSCNRRNSEVFEASGVGFRVLGIWAVPEFGSFRILQFGLGAVYVYLNLKSM